MRLLVQQRNFFLVKHILKEQLSLCVELLELIAVQNEVHGALPFPL